MHQAFPPEHCSVPCCVHHSATPASSRVRLHGIPRAWGIFSGSWWYREGTTGATFISPLIRLLTFLIAARGHSSRLEPHARSGHNPWQSPDRKTTTSPQRSTAYLSFHRRTYWLTSTVELVLRGLGPPSSPLSTILPGRKWMQSYRFMGQPQNWYVSSPRPVYEQPRRVMSTRLPCSLGRWASFSRRSLGRSLTRTNPQLFAGQVPFSGIHQPAAFNLLATGARPPRPQHSELSDQIWEVIQQCWHDNACRRMPIKDVVAILEAEILRNGPARCRL
jgi:hypothetical protein